MVHCHAPLLVHFQFLSEGTYGSFPTGYQLFQVLIPQFLSGPALSCTLPASLKFCLQVNFSWLPTTFARLLYFASNHLTVIHLGRQASLARRSLPLPSPAPPAWPGPAPAPGEEGAMVLTASSRLTVLFPDATVTGTRDQFRNGRADPGGGPKRLLSQPPPPPPPP